MVFDTRTVDTMKESLAHYFEISCEELVEFIKEAADNTQAKSRGLFNADIFTEELDAFLENIEVTEQINGVMCFHFSKGNILYDKETKDTEIVPFEESIDTYMAREVFPHVPDAKAFFEENLGAKKPVIKTGAEIPFTRHFYKYQQPAPSEELETKFMELERSVSERVSKLFE